LARYRLMAIKGASGGKTECQQFNK